MHNAGHHATHTSACACIKCTQVHTQACSHMHIHTRPHTYIHTFTHIRMHTHAHTHSHSNIHTRTQEGRQAGDVAIGRYLADTMAVVPRFSRTEFEHMFNESVQDSVMVSYLANLMRAQVGGRSIRKG